MMTHTLAQRQTSLTVTTISPESEEMVKSHCPSCCSYLVIHMPDPDSPDRMLAICSGCDVWYYIEVAPDGESAVMVRLPDVATTWASKAG